VAADAAIDRLATAHRLHVDRRYAFALRGFAARMTEAQAEALAADPGVAVVEQDAIARSTAVQHNATWGLDRIDQASLPLDSKYVGLGDGGGVDIYVIDTGIRYSHVELANRVLPGAYAIDDGRMGNDCNGHGSHVAGIAAGTMFGVAKRATIVPVRVLGCDGNGTVTQIVAGIDWIIANRGPSSVANLSLAVTGGSDVLDAAVRNLIASGVTTVVAAGNFNNDSCTISPARVREAITVGATTQTDARAVFSSYGPCVDISAPGTGILSIGIASDSASVTSDGTSMAAPHVAGVAANYLSVHPGATPTQVTAAILVGGTPNKMFDTMGSPNLLLNTAFLDTAPPATAITRPQAGAILPPSFVVEAEVTDPNLDQVELGLDGTPIDATAAAPFRFDLLDLAAGPHTISITATDLAGRSSTQTVTIVVTRGQPTGDDPDLAGGCSAGTGDAPAIPLLAMVVGLLCVRRRAMRRRVD
jgi:subtilisin family serine protease